MQQRHPKPVAGRLEDAIRGYEEVIREADAFDTSPKGVSTPEGRAGIVAGITRIVEIEKEAVSALEGAAGAME